MTGELDQRRLDLIAEIKAVFEGVTRDGGVSWSQAYVIDGYGDQAAYDAAGKEDLDVHWNELVSDENWLADGIGGGFAFLDAIGFRYYLPAAMIRELAEPRSTGLEFRLNLPPPGAKGRKFHLAKWELLDDRQRRCVASFIQFAIDRELASEQADENVLQELEHAWDNYWKAVQ